MRVCIQTVVALALPVAAAHAQGAPPTYRFEVVGSYRVSEVDTNPDLEITQYGVSGTYYLAPVSLASHPWSEAAFLEHATGVSVGVRHTDFEIATFDADGPTIGAGFLFATKEDPIAARIDVAFGTLDGDMGIDVDQTNVSGWVGYWLQPNALVGAELDYEEIEAGGLLDIEQLRVGVFGKVVHDLGEGRSINAEARIGAAQVDVPGSDETNVSLRVEGDYYFTPQYSAGALVDFSFGDAASEEGVTFGVRGTAWLNHSAALSVAYSVFDASDSAGSDESELGLSVTVRF